MSASSPDKQKFREFVGEKVWETTQVCARKGLQMALGHPSLNLIVASELIKLGSAYAIKLGADEDGIARLARGCYNDAVPLARALPAAAI